MVMWQGDFTVVDMAQWLVAMWPSHGQPRGNGKMPNDSSRTNFKNIYIYIKRCGGSTKSDRTTTTYCKNSDVLFAALWTKLSILSQNRGNL
jgi:hypothetical protein